MKQREIVSALPAEPGKGSFWKYVLAKVVSILSDELRKGAELVEEELHGGGVEDILDLAFRTRASKSFFSFFL